MDNKIRTKLQNIWDDKPRLIVGIVLAIGLITIFIWAILPNSSPEWTGFGAYDIETQGPRAKTLWDWLDLLLVPALLFFVGWWLTQSERETENRIAKKRRIEDRNNVLEQLRQASLEAYIGRISKLIIENNLGDLESQQEKISVNIKNIARMWSLAVFIDLDGDRKGQIIQFLYESGLIKQPIAIDLSRVNLDLTNLWRAKLIDVQLPNVSLKEANLTEAIMSRANISGSNLTRSYLEKSEFLEADLSNGTNLTEAKLQSSLLYRANLRSSILTRTNFTDATLVEANITQANAKNVIMNNTKLMGANLSGSDLLEAEMEGADLSKAKLIEATLVSTNLSDAILRDVDFEGSDLNGADLTSADLTNAKISIEQLQQAKSLDGAIMPNGTIYEGHLAAI